MPNWEDVAAQEVEDLRQRAEAAEANYASECRKSKRQEALATQFQQTIGRLEQELAEARALASEALVALSDGYETMRKAEGYWLAHTRGIGDTMRAESDWEQRVNDLLATGAARADGWVPTDG